MWETFWRFDKFETLKALSSLERICRLGTRHTAVTKSLKTKCAENWSLHTWCCCYRAYQTDVNNGLKSYKYKVEILVISLYFNDRGIQNKLVPYTLLFKNFIRKSIINGYIYWTMYRQKNFRRIVDSLENEYNTCVRTFICVF